MQTLMKAISEHVQLLEQVNTKRDIVNFVKKHNTDIRALVDAETVDDWEFECKGELRINALDVEIDDNSNANTWVCEYSCLLIDDLFLSNGVDDFKLRFNDYLIECISIIASHPEEESK